MINLCIFILLIIIIIALACKQPFSSPVVIFTVSFFILFVLEKFQFYGLYEVDYIIYWLITLGVISFIIGSLLTKVIVSKYPFKNQNINLTDNLGNYISLHYKTLVMLILFSCIVELLYAWPSLLYIKNGGSLYDMRYTLQAGLQRAGIVNFLHTYVALPIFFIALPLSIFSYFIKEYKTYFFLVLITTFFYFIGNGARMPLIYFILSLISFIALFYKKIKNKKIWRRLVIFGIISIFVMYVITIFRKSGKNISSDNYTFLQGMYYYLGGSMVNLQEKLPYVATHQSLYGIATLYGLFLPINNIFNISLVNYSNYLFDSIQNGIVFISTQSSQGYNFGVTGFLYSYADGKLIGLLLISFGLGILTEAIYIGLKNQKNVKYYVLYSLIMQQMMMYVITDMLSGISFTLALIYGWLFLNNVDKIVLNKRDN